MIRGHGINIGASIEAVKEARRTLLDIMKQPVGDNVKVAAIEALTKLCDCSHATVTNCSIVGDARKAMGGRQ